MATFTEPDRIARLEAIALVRAALDNDEAAFGAFELANPLSEASLQQFLALIWLARDVLLALTEPDRDRLLDGLVAALVGYPAHQGDTP